MRGAAARTALRVVVLSVIVALGAAGALASRPATRAQLHGIALGALPPTQPYFRCGRIGFARVSTAGPYGLVDAIARGSHRCRRSFQNALLLLRQVKGRWHRVADIYYEPCARTPRGVLSDLKRYMLSRHLLGRGAVQNRGCFGTIARAA